MEIFLKELLSKLKFKFLSGYGSDQLELKLPLDILLYKIPIFLKTEELFNFLKSAKLFYSNIKLQKALLKGVIEEEIENDEVKNVGRLIFNQQLVRSINNNFVDSEDLNEDILRAFLKELDKKELQKVLRKMGIREDIEIVLSKIDIKKSKEVITSSINEQILDLMEMKEFFQKNKKDLEKIETIVIKNKPLKYFPQFNIFPNVKEIIIENTDLEEFIINGNFPNLKKLRCKKNKKLEKLIIVGGHEKLEKIFCKKNSLINLSITNCRNLEELVCNNNNLEIIDGQGCENLLKIYCSHNFLEERRMVNIPNNCQKIGIKFQKSQRKCQKENNCYLV